MRRPLGHGVRETPTALAGGRSRRQRGGPRREMHEHSASAGDHARQELLQQDQRRHRVTFDDGAQQIQRHVAKSIVHAGPLIDGVRYQAIDRAELAQRRLRSRSHRSFVGQIHGHAQNPRTRADALADHATLGGHLVDRTRQRHSRQRITHRRSVEPRSSGHRTRGQNEMMSALGQRQRGGPTDAPTGSGHHDYPWFGHALTVSAVGSGARSTVRS